MAAMGQLRIGITGHRGLPPETTNLVTTAIRDVLKELPVDVVGVTMLADGPDSMFAEEVLDQGGQLEVVVPAERYRDGLPPEHRATYDRLLGQAARVDRLRYRESTEEAHMAGSEVMLDRIDRLLAVWDGKPARGVGGTADVVRAAENLAIPVMVIWPEGSSRD
jgi:hypothetical protein